MATKKYLDYAGLKRVLAKLLPGARKIWHGTLAEWKALSEAERDKYDQAEIIDGSGNGNGNDNDNDNDNGLTAEYIRNLHDPDWSQAVSITATQLIEGYTVPKRGIIVGSIIPNTYNVTGSPIIKINGIVVSYARGSSNEVSHGSVQCPVCANDRASLEGISADSCDAHISFVPYKVQ